MKKSSGTKNTIEGILLIDKPAGKPSFSLVGLLRKLTGVQKIGHAGTLDPFAQGVMVMLIGKKYTKRSNQFLEQDKEYQCTLHLGVGTDSFDTEGKITNTSDTQPELSEVEQVISTFQGKVEQIPPMFSAKKVGGKKLYELARKGIEIERSPIEVTLTTTILSYNYPYLELNIRCSKGTYIRSLAHDIGIKLGTFAHLCKLTRLSSGSFHLKDCLPLDSVIDPSFTISAHLLETFSEFY